jgi:hypothetical protein
VDKYLPLFPSGYQQAISLGYIDKNDPPNGNLCLTCGALVSSRWLHDHYHGLMDEDDEDDE